MTIPAHRGFIPTIPPLETAGRTMARRAKPGQPIHVRPKPSGDQGAPGECSDAPTYARAVLPVSGAAVAAAGQAGCGQPPKSPESEPDNNCCRPAGCGLRE